MTQTINMDTLRTENATQQGLLYTKDKHHLVHVFTSNRIILYPKVGLLDAFLQNHESATHGFPDLI